MHRWLPRNLGGVEAAMLLGDKSELTDAWRDTFAHGGHLAPAGGFGPACGAAVRAVFYGAVAAYGFIGSAGPCANTVLPLYMLLTGLPISVFRAGVMFLMMLLGDLYYEPIDLLTARGRPPLSGLQKPFAPCDIGFQLSVCAVLGVLAASAGRIHSLCRSTYPRPGCRRLAGPAAPLAIVLRAVHRCRRRHWHRWQPYRSWCCRA